MKKITLLFLLLLTFSFNSFAQFPENFDTELPTTWSTFIGTNSEGTVENWEYNSFGYMFVAWEDVATLAEDWLVSPQIAITSTNSLLTFNQTDYYIDDYGSTLTIRISTGSSQTSHGDFTIVDTQNETDVTNGTALTFSRHEVDLSVYEGQSVFIAFVWAQDNGDALFIDDINLENQNVSAPDAVTTPAPTDTTINVPIDATDPANLLIAPFTWVAATTGDPATSFNINLGTNAAGNNIGTISGFNSGGGVIFDWAYNTTYYWSINAVNFGGSTPSAVWSFTTESDPSLSINDDQLKLFHVFPNPVKGVVTINTNKTIESISIMNQLGQKIMNFNQSQIFNNKVDLTSLKKGMYFMNISSENKSQSIKIIKD
ncbi:putative secreted protein (Por secretion system target) [Mariniflexile fucanivorans]|uniref:Putative secreted protein (Por secretion system target) n=1 Tax=Mariniflexile fucanivorans TaxID=264023 RepID=A0A4R1RHE4_9FLAO|nr:choice-of-anchor J domain-containing protein [Mariniflexile fucanivorans]TCL65464.1 putative secreted protein (Por secretion system target) [Mariniflexile fucanivorans]